MSFLAFVNWLMVGAAVVLCVLKIAAPQLPGVRMFKPSSLMIVVGIAFSAAGNLIGMYQQFLALRGVFVYAPFIFFGLAIYLARRERTDARN